jgi:predicted transposase/invertase (TIGR01784 family)
VDTLVSPLVDFVFKILLGSEQHKDITIHFLNAVLEGQPPIVDVEFLNPMLEKETEEDRLSILDILAEDTTGRRLHVEMQRANHEGLAKRIAYYNASLFSGQLEEGEDYPALRPAISICVLEGSLFKQAPRMHLDFRLRTTFGEVLTDNIQIHLIELQKSLATEHNVNRVGPLEQWAYFFRNADRINSNTLRQQLSQPVFDSALGVLEMIKRDPRWLSLYHRRLKLQMDERARIAYAEEEARSKGLVEGRAEGRVEGRAEGRTEGEARGEQIGLIHGFQRILALAETPRDELAKLSLDSLSAMARELEQQYEAKKG